MKYLFIISSFSLLVACSDSIPKPKALLSLEYPTAQYEQLNLPDYPFIFMKNKQASISQKGNNIQLHYKKMKATIYLNFRDLKRDNLKNLIKDAQKLTYEHVLKAHDISQKNYENSKKKVYGTLYKVTGNAASQTQFYLTDSIKRFVLGSLYFYAEPNYDSLYPAIAHIDKDINKVIESLEWKN